MQLILDVLNSTTVELLSSVGMEFMMFAVATIAYLLLVGDGNGALSLLKKHSSCCDAKSPKVLVTPAQTPPRNRKGDGQSRDEGQSVISTIRARARAKDLHGVLAAFRNLKASNAVVNPQVHNCFIEACLQCDDLNGALEHFRKIAASGTADVVTYNTVLKALLHLGRSEEAQKLLREMATRGLPASRVTFHELLNSEVSAGNQRAIWKVVDEMKAAGHAPDAVTCSILAKCLKEGAHPWNIERVMNLVAELGGPIDEVLLSSVVEGCIRMKRLDLLAKVLEQFKKQDGDLKLSAPCYGSLIKAYGQSGDISRMWELWREMSQRNVKATAITLGCMVDALVTNYCVRDAWDLLNETYANEEDKQLVNTVIYSTVLKGFAWAKDIKCVFQVFDEMTKRGIACNTITYNTMIDACARSGTMDRVPRLLGAMAKEGTTLDLVTYSSLVKGYALSGDVCRGFQVVEEMKNTGLKPDEIMHNLLLDGCAKEGRVEEALKLLQSMQSTGVKPSNHTLSILVKLLGRARRLEEAFKLVEDLPKRHGFQLNVQVYTTLIQACLNSRKLDLAMQVHKRMASDPACKPDEKVYSVLVRGCLQANGLNEAVCALRCAYRLDKTVKSHAPGVEAEVLAEAMAQLRSSSAAHREAASSLVSDCKTKHGFDLEARIAGVVRSNTGQFRAGARACRGRDGQDRRGRFA
jgi:pentatricopeptide repeat protein